MTNDGIRIRTYNVGFGDCFLVRLPERERTRHLLVDFGNAIGKGGSNATFASVAENIEKETGGHLDVVVMSHEHADHMEGFYHQRDCFRSMQVDNVWVSMPSHPDYYRDYPQAEVHRRMKQLVDDFDRAASKRGLQLAPSFERLVRNNLTNVQRVDFVRDELGETTWYLARGASMRGTGLGSVKVKILAPEDDVSTYYGGGARHAHGRALAGAVESSGVDPWSFPSVARASSKTPVNLSGTEWGRLKGKIQNGGVNVMRAIDRAQNNTSLVFTIEAAGKTLFFPGDAELESWATMTKKRLLKPVDFLKVSHHGSHNGTPMKQLDDLLPKARKNKAVAVLSTQSKVYGTLHPVPDASLIRELEKRVRKLYSTDGSSKPWIDVYL